MSGKYACLLAVLAGTATCLGQAADAARRPTGPIQVNPSPEALGDLIQSIDVQSATSDGVLGVAYGWDHFWVSYRGVGAVPPHGIAKFDLTGTLVATYQQNAAASASAWGGRDGHADENVDELYFGHEGGAFVTYKYNPGTGGIDGGSAITTGVPATVRALTKLPSGNFITGDFSNFVHEFNSAGSLVSSTVLTGTSVFVYGFGWDTDTSTLWVYSQDATLVDAEEYSGSPGAGWTPTGRSFAGINPGIDIAGGMDIACVNNTPVFAGINQGTLDTLNLHDIEGGSCGGPPPLKISYINAPTSAAPGANTVVDVKIDPGSDTLVAGSAKLFYRESSSASYISTNLSQVAGTTWTGTLPGFDCSDSPQYYAQAQGVTTGVKTTAVTNMVITTGTQNATFLDVDFESGLPSGSGTSGLWHLTSACAPSASCDGPTTAYFGVDATCNFSTGLTEVGSLTMPLDLSTAGSGSTITLDYCYARVDEGGATYDIARVLFNGNVVDSGPPQSATFTTRSVDLSAYAGQSGTLEFSYNTVDSVANATLGWMIDGVKVAGSKLVCEDCYADCDGSGSLDFFDFLCFQNEFAGGNSYADCDNSGSLDFFDFLCFQNEFAAGCP